MAATYAVVSAFSRTQAIVAFVLPHSSYNLEAALAKARPAFHPLRFTVGATETFETALGLALVLAYSRFGDRFGALVEDVPAQRPPRDDISGGLFDIWRSQSRRE